MTGKKIQVLLLEDEAAHAEAIRRGLESADGAFQLQVVDTLKKFHAHVAANPPDIALIDMVLPDGNGIDLLSSPLKSNPFPMLILTSHGDEKAAVAALKAGALDYIVKSPETFANVSRILTRNLQQWSLIQENRKAAQLLQASEANFRNSIDSSPIGIYITTPGWVPLYANQAFLNIFGYQNIEELMMTPPSTFYTAESQQEMLQRIRDQQLGAPVPKEIEASILRKDGTIRHLHILRTGVVWNGTQQYQLFYNDITERKQAEEKLMASEDNLHNFLDNSIMGVRIRDENERVLYLNQAFLDIFGYKNIDEAKMISPVKQYTPESYAKYLQRAEKIARGEIVPHTVEIDIIRKDGATRHLEVIGRSVIRNGKQHGQTIYHDITERVQAETALKESEKKYRLIVENNSDIIFTTSAQEEFAYVSPSVTNVLGYNPTELIGKPFISLVHPDDLLMMQEEIKKSYNVTSKFGQDIEYRIHAINGEWRWVISKGTRVIDENGNFVYFIGIMRDMTTIKQAEKEKQQLEDKAQINSRLAAVGEMAAGIAPEINNPLTAVIGFSQLLLEKQNVPEDVKDDVRMISDGSKRVADIVKRLLTFARQTKPVKTSVNLNELIDNTLKLRQYVLKTANINVVTNYHPELPYSVVDPGQMQQVFLNLIVNAEQAMKKAHGKGILKITTEKAGNFIRILFQDDGPGITKEIMAHMFEPVFSTKDVGERTGLGLSLSRSIVLEHGGQMSVESESGLGATFIVELPIIDASLSEPEKSANENTAIAGKNWQDIGG